MRRSRVKNEQAFSLVEILASVVLISIVLIGVLNLFIFTNKTAVTNNDKLVAINLAKATIERMKIKPDDFFPLPNEEPAPEYVGRDAENPIHYDGTHCLSEECENLYAREINDVTYNVKVSISQDSIEQNLRLINAVVRVEHSDKKISSTVEGYISYDSNE